MIDARSRCSIFFVFVSFASMLMLVCCSSSCPRQTSPCFQISFFSSVASHFIRLREKKEGYFFFLYLFFIMFLLLFKKIWTIVAHFFLVCYACQYAFMPYDMDLALTRYPSTCFFFIVWFVRGTYSICMYVYTFVVSPSPSPSFLHFFFYALFRRL